MRRRVTALLLAAVVGLAACQPAVAEGLTDPREILGGTLSATAAMRTATIRAELRIRDLNNPNAGVGGVDGGVLEGQVDLAASEFSARALGADGRELFRAIVADGAAFSGTANGRWQRTPMEAGMLANPLGLFLGGMVGAGGPDVPDVPAILAQALLDPAIAVALIGVEDCPAGRCYRSAVEIPPAAVWQLFVRLTRIDMMRGGAAEPPADQLPNISIQVLSDTASLRLVDMGLTAQAGQVTVEARLRIANPDGPVSIEPPPPNLVDDVFNPGFAPAPMPVPVPAQPAEPVPSL